VAVITKGANILTLVITIEVKPENCEALLELIIEESRSFVRHQPGFISANLHRNRESTRIVNYGQWENQELYEKARSSEGFKSFSKRVEALAEKITPMACEVVFTEERHG
jgi:quinol monooxygenase YgiN